MTTQARNRIVMLDPVGEAKKEKGRLAPRLSDVRGKSMGYLFNGHPQWSELWNILHDRFEERYEPAAELRQEKPNVCAPAPRAYIEEMARKAEAVIVGVGA